VFGTFTNESPAMPGAINMPKQIPNELEAGQVVALWQKN